MADDVPQNLVFVLRIRQDQHRAHHPAENRRMQPPAPPECGFPAAEVLVDRQVACPRRKKCLADPRPKAEVAEAVEHEAPRGADCPDAEPQHGALPVYADRPSRTLRRAHSRSFFRLFHRAQPEFLIVPSVISGVLHFRQAGVIRHHCVHHPHRRSLCLSVDRHQSRRRQHKPKQHQQP